MKHDDFAPTLIDADFEALHTYTTSRQCAIREPFLRRLLAAIASVLFPK